MFETIIAFTGHALIAFASYALIVLAVLVRVLLRPHREPASRIAWIVVVIAFPGLGILTYILFGEVTIGRRRIARLRKVLEELPPVAASVDGDESRLAATVPERYEHLFRVGHSISGFDPIGGNAAKLLHDSNATIDAMAADIDNAKDQGNDAKQANRRAFQVELDVIKPGQDWNAIAQGF